MYDDPRVREGMARMVRDFAGAWEDLTTEVEDVVESDDSLVATIRYRGRGASASSSESGSPGVVFAPGDRGI